MRPSEDHKIEYLTIMARSAAEVMEQFSKRGLASAGYSIAGQMGRHRVTVVTADGANDVAGNEAVIAATFRRVVAI